jgi:hypothetical protein
MRKMLLIMAMAALVCWLPGQALAVTSSYVSSLGIQGSNNFTPAESPFGTITVNLNSSQNIATVTIAGTENPVDLDIVNGATSASPVVDAALNVVNPTGGSIPNFTATAAPDTSGTTNVTKAAGQTFDSLGTFNITASGYGGGTDNFEDIVFTLTAGAGDTWANAASVLTGNGLGEDGGALVYLEGTTSDTTYIGEEVTAVPLPPTALLLGCGLLGLVGLGWRKRSAFDA